MDPLGATAPPSDFRQADPLGAYDPLGATGPPVVPPPPALYPAAGVPPDVLEATPPLPPTAAAVDPVRVFLGERYFEKDKVPTLQPDLNGLQALAQVGQFEQLIAVSEIIMQGFSKILPHERLAVRHARLIGFVRLRRHDVALAELEEVGDLERGVYRYETYPSNYPGQQGSFVPFSLRLLKAEMPARMSKDGLDATIDALVSLRSACREQQQPQGSTGVVAVASGESATVWSGREDVVTDRLVSHASAGRDVEKVVELLKEQAERRPVGQRSGWLNKLVSLTPGAAVAAAAMAAAMLVLVLRPWLRLTGQADGAICATKRVCVRAGSALLAIRTTCRRRRCFSARRGLLWRH
jgi:hypothetical protein